VAHRARARQRGERRRANRHGERVRDDPRRNGRIAARRHVDGAKRRHGRDPRDHERRRRPLPAVCARSRRVRAARRARQLQDRDSQRHRADGRRLDRRGHSDEPRSDCRAGKRCHRRPAHRAGQSGVEPRRDHEGNRIAADQRPQFRRLREAVERGGERTRERRRRSVQGTRRRRRLRRGAAVVLRRTTRAEHDDSGRRRRQRANLHRPAARDAVAGSRQGISRAELDLPGRIRPRARRLREHRHQVRDESPRRIALLLRHGRRAERAIGVEHAGRRRASSAPVRSDARRADRCRSHVLLRQLRRPGAAAIEPVLTGGARQSGGAERRPRAVQPEAGDAQSHRGGPVQLPRFGHRQFPRRRRPRVADLQHRSRQPDERSGRRRERRVNPVADADQRSAIPGGAPHVRFHVGAEGAGARALEFHHHGQEHVGRRFLRRDSTPVRRQRDAQRRRTSDEGRGRRELSAERVAMGPVLPGADHLSIARRASARRGPTTCRRRGRTRRGSR